MAFVNLFISGSCIKVRVFQSFSLGICDCTFNAEDGGLHLILGLFGYLLTLPFVAIEMLQGK